MLEILVFVGIAVIALSWLARRLGVSPPIMLLLGGIPLAFVPALAGVEVPKPHAMAGSHGSFLGTYVENKTVATLVRPIRFVPETKPVKDLMREMQADNTHLVIVVDEYGNTAGLASMEDLVEVIVGEIRDEHEPGSDITHLGDGSVLVSGSFDVARLYDLFEFRPQEETESTTIGGLLSEWLGRVPVAGESVERNGIRAEVVAGNDLRVEQVKLRKARSAQS